jgi:hypothetical protein
MVLEKLRQKDAPKIEAARQECERRKQQQIEAKAAREEAERQAKIEAARQENLRKEAEQKAMAEKAERDRKDAEARVALCYGEVSKDKAQELANAAINDVRAKMDRKSPPVDQLVADRLRYLLGQHLNAESDDERMPGFTRLTVTKEAAAAVVACYDGVQQLMKEQVRAIEEAQRSTNTLLQANLAYYRVQFCYQVRLGYASGPINDVELKRAEKAAKAIKAAALASDPSIDPDAVWANATKNGTGQTPHGYAWPVNDYTCKEAYNTLLAMAPKGSGVYQFQKP